MLSYLFIETGLFVMHDDHLISVLPAFVVLQYNGPAISSWWKQMRFAVRLQRRYDGGHSARSCYPKHVHVVLDCTHLHPGLCIRKPRSSAIQTKLVGFINPSAGQ